MEGIDLVQLGILIVSFTALLAAIIINAIQFRHLGKQQKLEVFFDYTNRYQNIKLLFPSTIYRQELESSMSEEVLRALRAYFDLCSEEFYLAEQKKIDQSVWEMWKEEIMDSVKKPAFQHAWRNFRSDYSTYPSFVKFIDSSISSKS